MTPHRVFVVSNTGLSAFHRNGSGLFDAFLFDAHVEGRAQFDRYLEGSPSDVACVLAADGGGVPRGDGPVIADPAGSVRVHRAGGGLR